MKAKMWMARKNWTPATIGSNETTPLFQLPSGSRVRSLSARYLTNAGAATGSSFVVGDGTATNGFITVSDTEVDTFLDAGGTFMANAGGKLYTVADTVDIVYTASGTPGAVKPVVQFAITVQQEWA